MLDRTSNDAPSTLNISDAAPYFSKVVWGLIAGHLSNEDILALMLTSRGLYSALNTNHFWKHRIIHRLAMRDIPLDLPLNYKHLFFQKSINQQCFLVFRTLHKEISKTGILDILNNAEAFARYSAIEVRKDDALNYLYKKSIRGISYLCKCNLAPDALQALLVGKQAHTKILQHIVRVYPVELTTLEEPVFNVRLNNEGVLDERADQQQLCQKKNKT